MFCSQLSGYSFTQQPFAFQGEFGFEYLEKHNRLCMFTFVPFPMVQCSRWDMKKIVFVPTELILPTVSSQPGSSLDAPASCSSRRATLVTGFSYQFPWFLSSPRTLLRSRGMRMLRGSCGLKTPAPPNFQGSASRHNISLPLLTDCQPTGFPKPLCTPSVSARLDLSLWWRALLLGIDLRTEPVTLANPLREG